MNNIRICAEEIVNAKKIFVILGFFGVVITMFFVNIMGGSSQHAYS